MKPCQCVTVEDKIKNIQRYLFKTMQTINPWDSSFLDTENMGYVLVSNLCSRLLD